MMLYSLYPSEPSHLANRARLIEALQVAASDRGPDHAAAVSDGACAEGQSFCIIAQEIDDLACDGLAVPPRHEYTAPVGEEFARIKIRRGDDGFAGAYRIGQRPGRALLRLEVRRYIDVCGGEKLDKFAATHETIVKDHARVHAEFLSPPFQPFAVALAVTLFDRWLGGSEAVVT